MRCPYCYEKIPKYQDICPVCGFSKQNLQTARNDLVKEMRIKDPESVIYSTIVPVDLNKRKLLKLALFGGIIGLHDFYCQRKKRGIFQIISMIILLIGTPIIFGDFIFIPFLYSEPTFTAFVGIIGAIGLFNWISDIIAILLGKFKIPVVLKDRI